MSEVSGERLEPLLPPLARGSAAPSASLPFLFWIHSDPHLDWIHLLQCDPDWDSRMESQNAAEIWLLRQLMTHPNRTDSWQKARVVLLPILPLASLRVGRCFGTDHPQRLRDAVGAMLSHPAYGRRHGHDHLLLFNHWDAWGAFGDRWSHTHSALSNVSFGWHETADAAWGMANHRHVGKCQLVLPYVEPRACAELPEAMIAADGSFGSRTTSIFFAGAAADFDTPDGCPNVATHSVRVRRSLFALAGEIPGAKLRQIPHNMRHCNGSILCEERTKRKAADEMRRARYCAIAAGDTPSTGRLYDAIACGCVPLILVDDLELPFPSTAAVPLDAFGVRVKEKTFLADPQSAIRQVVQQPAASWRHAQRRVLLARRRLAYRAPGSIVASLALREAWATCLRQDASRARPPSSVAKC